MELLVGGTLPINETGSFGSRHEFLDWVDEMQLRNGSGSNCEPMDGDGHTTAVVYFPDGATLSIPVHSDRDTVAQVRARISQHESTQGEVSLFAPDEEDPLRNRDLIGSFGLGPLFAIPTTFVAPLLGKAIRLSDWKEFCRVHAGSREGVPWQVHGLDFSGIFFTVCTGSRPAASLRYILKSLKCFTVLTELILASLDGIGGDWRVWPNEVASSVLHSSSVTRIRRLDISGNDIRLDGASVLARALESGGCQSLEELTFSGNSTRMDSTPVVLNGKLTEGRFAGCGLGFCGSIVLFAFLPRCKFVSLDLSCNDLRAGGAVEATHFLGSYKHLAHLDVSSNSLNRNSSDVLEPALKGLLHAARLCPELNVNSDGNDPYDDGSANDDMRVVGPGPSFIAPPEGHRQPKQNTRHGFAPLG
jgi:hypothetical protein